MKLFFSPTSPYVRKVLVTAHELGLADRIEKVTCAASPINRDTNIVAQNPLGQVPTLIDDDGQVHADSRVICEVLNDIAAGGIFPKDRAARWKALNDQSLADGMLVAALLLRYETFMRPEALRWPQWVAGQWDKVFSVLARFETEAAGFGIRTDIGTITLACALSYLDLRSPEVDWRANAPQVARWYETFSRRPSMVATALAG